MKKIFAWVLALCMMLTCAAALAEDITGEWSLIEIRVEGSSINPALFGMDMVFDFTADGTCRVTTSYGEESETADATWTQNGNAISVAVNGTVLYEMVLENGTLTMDGGLEGLFVFSRDAVEAAEAELPVAVLAENADVFKGEWVLSAVSAGGALAPAEAMGAAGTMKIDDAKVVLAWSDTEMESEYTFGDGSLQFAAMGMEVSLALTDTGWLALPLEIEGTSMILYFVPQEAAAE